MRPAGDVRLALLQAARALVTPETAPTLAELAVRAGVGRTAAMHTVKNMTRCGDLRVARKRRVAYRNRPVAEYVVGAPVADDAPAEVADLGAILSIWTR